MVEYYITQERAFAPGISGEWPKVIVKPDNKNGRLVKLEGLRDVLIAADSELSAIAHGRPPSSKEELIKLSDDLRKYT